MKKLNKYLEKKAILITTDVNRFYLSGFHSSLGYLFIIKGKKILYVDSRYFEAAKNKTKKDVEVRLLKRLSLAFQEIKKEFSFKEIYLEAEITVREKISFSEIFQGAEVICEPELSDLLLSARSIKTQEEINFISQAQKFSEKAFLNILNFIEVGVSEKEIALRLEYDMQTLGAEGISFETIAITGKKTSMPHGVPDESLVKNGDFITMDFGATYGGYHSDMTRTIAVGYVTDEMAKVYDTVLKAQLAAIEKAAAGVLCRDVDKTARDIIEGAGYGEYFNHSTGHGVGLEIHEAPNLSPNCDKKLLSGNVVTVEPGIYIENSFGVRIEDMLLIKENGSKNLTNIEKSLIILK